MTLVLVLLLVVVVGLAVATTVGYVRGGLPVATPDVPPPLDAPVAEAADLDRARFGLAFRGYRMDQVDEVLDGARDAMARRDAEIALLRGQLEFGGDDGGLDAARPEVAQPAATELEPAQPDPVASQAAQPHPAGARE